jgi:2-polyprenyl-3-methyl-5-hydroxy-6-metoxy-1,4-benzoquinol methylase
MSSFKDTQKHELDSWLIEDEDVRHEKAQREIIRYPLLKKQMGLNSLDTSKMTVWDIGCGPLGGVSSVLNARHVVRIDPLGEEYAKGYPQVHMLARKAEDLKEALIQPDLIIITNALDHFENPSQFLQDLSRYMKYGAYFAHLHAINNAYTHPHEAHAHNVNPEMFKEHLEDNFEMVWYEDFLNDGLTYSWRKQPAFSGLYRKIK